LDFLKNLSIEEARAIEDFSPFVLGAIVPRYGPVEEKAEPGIAHLLMLQELGLISGVGGTGLQFTASGGGASSYFRILFSRRRGIALRHSDAGKVLHLNTYRVTPLGSQVFTLPKVEPDEECLFATARACQSQGFSVSIVDLQEAPGQPGTFLMTSETPLPDSPLPQ
ncbi:membrane-fusion protein, partial [Cupriavidus basilensis OR16]